MLHIGSKGIDTPGRDLAYRERIVIPERLSNVNIALGLQLIELYAEVAGSSLGLLFEEGKLCFLHTY